MFTVYINGQSVSALYDSGCHITLAQPELLHVGQQLPLACVYSDVWQVPAACLSIATKQHSWPLKAGVDKGLMLTLLVGLDCPTFEDLFTSHREASSWRRCKENREPRPHPVYLAENKQEANTEGVSPLTN